MGPMSKSTSILTAEVWKEIDSDVQRFDEDRWLSSRYASGQDRKALIALYRFNLELARIRLQVTEAGLGAIRFQWWRDELERMKAKQEMRHVALFALQLQSYDHAALIKLVDDHEIAFEMKDRSKEPDVLITRLAAKQLASHHAWGEAIGLVAPFWASLRRSETAGLGDIVEKAPSTIRPAVAHLRLRRAYSARPKPSPFSKRICVMRAMLSGRV